MLKPNFEEADGQGIGVSNSPKQQTLKTQIFALAYWGRNFFVHFLRELKNLKISFRNQLTFSHLAPLTHMLCTS